ncbi:MAG: hypothetical protein HYV95_06445 [Opitutae bacterium]|nr:hypothetical protein [Opitutae bacterium]
MKLFEGLLLYEIILLTLGVVLFFALLGVMFYYVKMNRSITGLLLFFLLPVVMIAFPSIQKIKFDKDGLEIEKELARLVDQSAHATTPAEKEELKVKLDEFKERAATSPEALVTVARAQTLLGNVDASKQTLDQALTLDPKSPAALDLKSRVDKLTVAHPVDLRAVLKANAMVKR